MTISCGSANSLPSGCQIDPVDASMRLRPVWPGPNAPVMLTISPPTSNAAMFVPAGASAANAGPPAAAARQRHPSRQRRGLKVDTADLARLAAVTLRGDIGQRLPGVGLKSAIAQSEMRSGFRHLVGDLISSLAVGRYDAVLRHSVRQRLERIRIDADLILAVEQQQLLGRLEFNALIDFRCEEQIQNEIVLARRGESLANRCDPAQAEYVQRERVRILEAHQGLADAGCDGSRIRQCERHRLVIRQIDRE